MPRVHPLIEGFNAGEFSEKLAARVSFAKYPLGASTLKNALPLIQGAFTRRPGTRYLAPLKDETKSVKLFDFRFSTSQAYVIEAGDQYFRFFRNQGQIIAPNVATVITNGDFVSDISDWDDISSGSGGIAHDGTGERLALTPGGSTASDIAWAEQDVAVSGADDEKEHVLRFKVDGAPGDTIELRIGSSSGDNSIVDDVSFAVGNHVYAFTPGDSVGTVYIQFRNRGEVQNKTLLIDDVALLDDAPVELVTPYLQADLASLVRAQSADVLYTCSVNYRPMKLTRGGHTSWSLVDVAFADGPYGLENTEATTLVASAGTGFGLTLTASATAGINGGAGFTENDVGRHVRIKNSDDWAWCVIVGFTDATHVTVDKKGATALPTVATATWRLGVWSNGRGYPSAITFFEQRLVLGGSNADPQTFWLSQSADFENMAPDDGADVVEADDALDFTISARQVNVIRWLAGGKNLIIGTVGGEWLVKSDGPILTPTDIDVKRHTTHGSAAIPPLEIGHVVLFLQAARRKIRQIDFDFNINGLKATDLTILSDHATASGIVDMAYQQEPQSTVWLVRGDGVLAALTYEVDHDVAGWSRHILGGSFAGDDPVVESVAVVPGNDDPGQVFPSDDRDEVWLVVKRTIDGQTRRYVEFMEGHFEAPRRDDYTSDAAWETATLSAQTDAFFVDGGLTYDGAPTSLISGLDHLEGETVSVFADGAIHPTRTVTSGQITLEAPASKVHAGLAFTHTWRGLKLAAGAQAGTPVGQIKRIHGVTLVLLDAMGGMIGPDEASLEPLVYREVADAMDTAVPLFGGERYASFDGDWGSDERIIVRGDAPVPFTCLAIIPEMTTNERP